MALFLFWQKGPHACEQRESRLCAAAHERRGPLREPIAAPLRVQSLHERLYLAAAAEGTARQIVIIFLVVIKACAVEPIVQTLREKDALIGQLAVRAAASSIVDAQVLLHLFHIRRQVHSLQDMVQRALLK